MVARTGDAGTVPRIADTASNAIERGELEARLNQLLTLAGNLPQGRSEDHVRRCVCEVIEAEGPNRPRSVVSLITSIAQLQHERELTPQGAHETGAANELTALSDAVAPMRPRLAPGGAAVQGDQMADELALRRTLRVAAIGLTAAAAAGTMFWLQP